MRFFLERAVVTKVLCHKGVYNYARKMLIFIPEYANFLKLRTSAKDTYGCVKEVASLT